MKITCISTVHSSALVSAARNIKKNHALPFELRVYYPEQLDLCVDPEGFSEELRSSDAVLVDIRGSCRAEEIAYETLKDGDNIVVNLVSPIGRMMSITRLGSFRGSSVARRLKAGEVRDPEDLWEKIKTIQGIVETAGKVVPLAPVRDAGNYIKIVRYWRYGGTENLQNLLTLLLREYLGCDLPRPPDPLPFPEYGIYHRGGFLDSLDALLPHLDAERATIGVLFYGNMHFDQCLPVLKALDDRLGDMNVIPVFSDGIHNLRAIRSFFLKDKPVIDAMINLTWFRINGGPLGGDPDLTKNLLNDLDVPVFAPVSMYQSSIDDWERSDAGLSPTESIMAVIWPELDGCAEPIPCCGVRSFKIDDMEVREVAAIDDRISRIASRIRSWVHLRREENARKRIALIIYNYPPGEENLGRASYLDVFASLKRLLYTMKDAGYSLSIPDMELDHLFYKMAAVNTGKWLQTDITLRECPSMSREEYMQAFKSLPEELQNEILDFWGEPPGEVMVSGGGILIPGLDLGNVFIGVQPARPPLEGIDLNEISHDKTKPPHHQYIAFYHWLQRVWRADAVVHIGTHGLAEFMKGKELALSSRCYPDFLIGDMPNLYFYHVVNTSEVIIAKRRLYAMTISYNSPPYTNADLYEGYMELEELIDEHSQAVTYDHSRADRLRERIFKRAGELNITAKSIDEIQDMLYEMKRRIIPKGLHVLGESYRKEDLESFMRMLLRYDRDGVRSLNSIVAEAMGLDYRELLKNRSRKLDEVDKICSEITGIAVDGSDRSYPLEIKGYLSDELKKTLSYGLEAVRRYSDNSIEIKNFIRGLDGRFIEPSVGGDIIRSPHALPTGKNLVQFDPTRIPTSDAIKRGEEIAENTIRAYIERTGSYPSMVGVVLWGFETTKTGGETIGQILRYLGVRLERDPGSLAVRIIPLTLEELGRPRVDCLVNICGFFRDMFPNVVQLLDRAFALVSSLEEPLDMNYVRKHTLDNMKSLLQNGMEEKQAGVLAKGRIFGPRAGEYGTRMLPLVEDSVWRTEDELAEVYASSMGHIYTEGIHAAQQLDLYRSNISRVDLVSQIRDSHDWEFIDLDHYFEFFGGLSSAVRSARGSDPVMLVSDTTGEVIRTEDIRSAVEIGVRTRLLNPRWIDGMLAHRFHGAQQIADRIENMLGLAATTHSVESWVWSSIAERYMFDETTRQKLLENNHYAAVKIGEWLMEAHRRGYWKAEDDEIERLRRSCLEMEGEIEDGGSKS
ncbi:MAG: magnesium chelatase subunit H [Methanothrix sp.]|uniref:Cobaltochelatase CobN subunit n=1 Tax=Methanothrix thermoacetophila (strain DSM 6194 / JCM 14653 / NBRC 101360 / PT) TaxID=349307 RepID=A0B7F0_METTP|nr:magnesium chelatase subunit H [Methanothrix thermoacetophila]ABK14624.1 cobaltochelatase CobN subunit [Methanothrix thermoacetophila PT]MBC7079106.1 magnesium chelatase subunit H [Methanothrix sp.]